MEFFLQRAGTRKEMGPNVIQGERAIFNVAIYLDKLVRLIINIYIYTLLYIINITYFFPNS